MATAGIKEGTDVDDRYAVSKCPGPVHMSLRPPGSKSLTNRALVCAALADGDSRLSGVLDSEDTRVMLKCLGQLGVPHTGNLAEGEITISGTAGQLAPGDHNLFVANSGTTMRFVACLAPLGRGRIHLDGIPRMRERPIRPLVEALRQLGIQARCSETGCPPVIVQANGFPGGQITIDSSTSSQYLSGLLLAAPSAQGDVVLSVEGELASRPYLEMTVEVMKRFGVEVTETPNQGYVVKTEEAYCATDFAIEPDASAASYLLAIPAIVGGSVTVSGLSESSLQGDVGFVHCLARMGCQVEFGDNGITVTGRAVRGIDVDMNEISDTVQTLAAVALFVQGETVIRNVAHIRHKETDRIGNLATELRKLGAKVEETADGLQISPGTPTGAIIETYGDHRMAMSLALAGLKIEGVLIDDPQCCEKTYPSFFADLETILATATP